MQGEGTSNYTRKGVAKARIGLGDRLEWSQAYFRAKCKAGIGFVIDQGFRVHFVMDSLYNENGMEAIARKESNQPWHTGSELRYVFRKRKDVRTIEQVLFYVDGEQVEAPWIHFPEIWKKYGDTRMDPDHVPDSARK